MRAKRWRSTVAVSTAMLVGGCGRLNWTLPAPSRTSIPNGAIHEDLFTSASLGVAKHLVVYLPPSYARDTTRRFPVAYYLHGLSGSETDWVSKGGIDAAADSLFNRRTPEMILVMPDGDDGWYTTWVNQLDYRTCADTLRAEAAEAYCVAHERYDTYVARDVVSYVDTHYRTYADRAHRGIAGLSMGGYGAITIALHFPEVFGAAASHSGVLSPMYVGPHPFVAPPRYASTVEDIRPNAGPYWSRYMNYWGTDLERWRAADPAYSVEVSLRSRSRMPALFIDCGTDDGFVDQNRALHAEFTRIGVRHEYAEWPGGHTWRYWSTHVRESLAWLAAEIGR
jgi:S-formylglutathione hydrolase FrmB